MQVLTFHLQTSTLDSSTDNHSQIDNVDKVESIFQFAGVLKAITTTVLGSQQYNGGNIFHETTSSALTDH